MLAPPPPLSRGDLSQLLSPASVVALNQPLRSAANPWPQRCSVCTCLPGLWVRLLPRRPIHPLHQPDRQPQRGPRGSPAAAKIGQGWAAGPLAFHDSLAREPASLTFSLPLRAPDASLFGRERLAKQGRLPGGGACAVTQALHFKGLRTWGNALLWPS